MSEPVDYEPGRKSLLVMLGAYAGLTLVVVAIGLVAHATMPRRRSEFHPRTTPRSETAPRRFPTPDDPLGPLARGAPFERWHVVSSRNDADGRVRIDAEDSSGAHVSLLLRPRGSLGPQPIADTTRYDVSGVDFASNASPSVIDAARAFASALHRIEDEGY